VDIQRPENHASCLGMNEVTFSSNLIGVSSVVKFGNSFLSGPLLKIVLQKGQMRKKNTCHLPLHVRGQQILRPG